jgi:uracil-DNA glycosylase
VTDAVGERGSAAAEGPPPSDSLPGIPDAPDERREALVEVYRRASVCTLCPLHEGRTTVVFGSGNADADLMFVGEAPGAEEDRQGLPFVGRAGRFLTELLEGIGMSRDDVFIANTLKCRPPGNRDPQPDEIATCRPWLEQQVQLIRPRVIATLGNFATKLLTGRPTGITKVRGTAQHHEIGGRAVLLLPLFHPAAGLRTPKVAEQLREDFNLIQGLLSEPLPEPAADPEPDSAPSAGGSELGLRDADDDGPVEISDDQMGLFGS